MAKVFSLFLVVVLAVAVPCFAIPPQEQAANAVVYPSQSAWEYRDGDLLFFRDIPRTSSFGYSNGFEVVFDVNTSYKPFSYIQVYSTEDNFFFMALEIADGYLSFYDMTAGFDLIADTAYTYPYRLEIYFGAWSSSLIMYIRYNHKVLFYGDTGYNVLQGSSYNVKFIKDYNVIPVSEWESLSASGFLATISLKPYTAGVVKRDWTDYDQASYDQGYTDGMNAAQTATVNIFPAFIGSIFAFFASIASYEILGISLLNIMIIVGSVLLLLAVLRVFLK